MGFYPTHCPNLLLFQKISIFMEADTKNTQKTHFTDTGSTVFVDPNNNLAKTEGSTPQSEHSFSEITENSAKTEENSQKTEESKENDIALPGNQENSQDNSVNFFNSENKSAFSREFPDVDLDKLRNREDFQAFLGILTANPTLSKAYACFNAIVSSAEETAEKKALQALANAKTSVGALAAKESGNEIYFSKEQVLRMSSDEIKRNFERIRQSQAKW